MIQTLTLAAYTKGSEDARIKELVKVLRAASKTYYNTGKIASLKLGGREVKVTDAVYDALQDELRTLAPNHVALHEIGALITKDKVDLPFPMASQTKIKGDDTVGCQRFLDTGEVFVISDKLDGVSAGHDTMDDPVFVTRGNGLVGQDITALLPSVKNIPNHRKRVQVRGELIMSKSGFEAWEAQFENARNAVSGLVNRTQLHKAVRDVEFIAYQLVYPKMSPSKGLAYLKQLGYKVVPHKVVSNLTPVKLNEVLRQRLEKSKYEIDGIIVTSDVYEKPAPHNPEGSRAFKQNMDADMLDVRVVDVVWGTSKHGYLKPRVMVEPTRLAGVTVTYATGHNAKFIVDNKIGVNSIIRIVRSGGVIPYIDSVVKGTKARMPDVAWTWNSTKVDAVAVDLSNEVEVKKSVEFFKAIGAEYIGPGLIAQMASDGVDTYDKILALAPKKWEAYGATAVKALASVQQVMKTATPGQFASATGLFGRGFGSRKFDAFLERYGAKAFETFTAMPAKSLYTYLLEDGVSKITAELFARGLKPFMRWLARHEIKVKAAPKIKAEGSKLASQVLYLTGFRDAELTAKIQQQGGTVASSFGSKTTMLVVKDNTVSNTKTETAIAKGIAVTTAAQLRKKLGI